MTDVISKTHRQQYVRIKNNTDGDAKIILYHKNDAFDLEHKAFNAKPGETVGDLQVNFYSGISMDTDDAWGVALLVYNGSKPGLYMNEGREIYRVTDELSLIINGHIGQQLNFGPFFQKHRLGSVDIHQFIDCIVDTELFHVSANNFGPRFHMKKN